MSLNFRTHYNHMNVKLDVEIDERDKILSELELRLMEHFQVMIENIHYIMDKIH